MAMAATSSLPPGFGGISIVRPHENLPARFRRSRGKRVTWASADQLCKIRMFLAEDAPIYAGVAQDQLQVKTTSFMHATDDLPPGFGGGFGAAVSSCLKVDTEALAASVVAAIPWRCPQRFELNPEWHVEAGEGSSEVEVQKQRESKTLEAVYPRSSAIPNSPFEATEPRSLVDDTRVPLIPVTAPDEDSDGDDGSAQAKPAALSQTSDQGSAIDPSLLLQLLANPSLVETLSGVRNNSMLNTSNGNGSVPPPSSSEMASQSVKNLTSNPVSTITQNVSSMGFSEAYTPYGTTAPAVAPAVAVAAASQPLSSGSTSLMQAAAPWVGQVPGSASTSSSSSSVSASAPSTTGDFPAGLSFFRNFPMEVGTSFQAPTSQQQSQFLTSQQQQQQQQQGTGISGLHHHHHPQNQQQGRPPFPRHDEQYFKELIMQHGGGLLQQQQQQQQIHQHHQQAGGGGGGGGQLAGNGYVTSNGFPPGFGFLAETATTASKQRRVCAYFNTAKGCRNGLKCPFLHDGKRLGGELPQHLQQQQKRLKG